MAERRLAELAAIVMLWTSLGAQWFGDRLWIAGDRLGRWANRG